MMPTVHTLAAVSVPVVISPCRMIAPAPIKPTPVILQNTCVAGSAGSDYRYSGLYQATGGHRHERKGTGPGVVFRTRPMPANRQGENECYEQMDQMVETVAPQAENAWR
jgi:hypothetical protein